MAALRKDTYIDIELEWAEEQLKSWKLYVDQHPIYELSDRMEYKQTKAGGVMPMCVATIEAQGKFIQETMKNYLALLKEVDAMREIETKKQQQAKGESSVPNRMRQR